MDSMDLMDLMGHMVIMVLMVYMGLMDHMECLDSLIILTLDGVWDGGSVGGIGCKIKVLFQKLKIRKMIRIK